MKNALTEDEKNPFGGKPKTAPVRIRRTTLDGKEVATAPAQERTMRIRLNRDYTGCLDGIHPSTFGAGQEADTPIHIAQVLLEDGRASLPAGAKMESGVPENKMLDGPGSNKGESGAKKGGHKRN
jgi:hypothetical protein